MLERRGRPRLSDMGQRPSLATGCLASHAQSDHAVALAGRSATLQYRRLAGLAASRKRQQFVVVAGQLAISFGPADAFGGGTLRRCRTSRPWRATLALRTGLARWTHLSALALRSRLAWRSRLAALPLRSGRAL